ncbi:IS21 family transposase [Mycoplasmatota bacterium]|nr:IS21 family transposase [Mycoplasmatota bacterium]
MILNYEIDTNIEIQKLTDLKVLKNLMETTNLKVNKSRLARELNVDRRTISKYINGYEKSKNRKRSSIVDDYYDLIKDLLNDKIKVFEYKKVLWQYLSDNYGLKCAESSFRRYISKTPEFQEYFDQKKKSAIKAPSVIRYETDKGHQAQLDWKESMNFVLDTGEVITINIFVLLLSYSRFRVYRLSLTKSQDILFNFIDEAFQAFGGVPHEILTDNMKTVMDVPRTEYSKGKVNNKFQQFANDYGFEVKPCIAGRPNTKAKVESPMKILDELKAYSGDLNYEQLVKKVQEINNRENSRLHRAYDMIPLFGLQNEKDFLQSPPRDTIRNPYLIKTITAKVNSSSMISYKGNQYSVPPKYMNRTLQLQVYDNQIHTYSNTNLVTIHSLSSKKLNYLEEHYIQIARMTLSFDDEDIQKFAKENLNKIGERYK